jgi:menaquinone-dependent protoporphyrinogen IX oxidase
VHLLFRSGLWYNDDEIFSRGDDEMILIAYYSRKGHVKKMAETYATKYHFDILEIKDTVNRHGIFGFLKAGSQAAKKISTPIEQIQLDLTAYDKVILCSPVWAGNMACPIRTFLKEYGSQIKMVEFVLMSGGKGNDLADVFTEMDSISGLSSILNTRLSRGQDL